MSANETVQKFLANEAICRKELERLYRELVNRVIRKQARFRLWERQARLALVALLSEEEPTVQETILALATTERKLAVNVFVFSLTGGVISVDCGAGCRLLKDHYIPSFSLAVCTDKQGNRETLHLKEISEGDGRPHCYEAFVQGHADEETFGDVVSWWRKDDTESHLPQIVDFLRQLADTGDYRYAEEAYAEEASIGERFLCHDSVRDDDDDDASRRTSTGLRYLIHVLWKKTRVFCCAWL